MRPVKIMFQGRNLGTKHRTTTARENNRDMQQCHCNNSAPQHKDPKAMAQIRLCPVVAYTVDLDLDWCVDGMHGLGLIVGCDVGILLCTGLPTFCYKETK